MEKSEIIAGLLDMGRKARKDYLENNNEEARKVNEIVTGAASLIGKGEASAPIPVPECLEVDDETLLFSLREMIEKKRRVKLDDPFARAMLKAMVGPLAFALPKAERENREEAATLTVAYNRLLALLSKEKKAEPMAEGSK